MLLAEILYDVREDTIIPNNTTTHGVNEKHDEPESNIYEVSNWGMQESSFVGENFYFNNLVHDDELEWNIMRDQWRWESWKELGGFFSVEGPK